MKANGICPAAAGLWRAGCAWLVLWVLGAGYPGGLLAQQPSPAGAAAAGVAMPGSIRPVAAAGVAADPRGFVSRAALTPAEAAAAMRVEFVLKTRHLEELRRRVQAGEKLGPAEMAARYLPRPGDYEAVAGWLASQGLSVEPAGASRSIVFASGTPAQLGAALRASFARVSFRGADYTAAISAPSLPADVAARVTSIHGLQPYLHPRKFGTTAAAVTIAPPYLVSEILNAYGAAGAGVTGAGQQIGIVIDTVPSNSDITKFWTANAINQSLSNIITVNVSGSGLPPASGEETLDVSWSSGIAPGAQVIIYACGNLDNVNASYSRIIDDLQSGAEPNLHQISMSFGGGEETDESTGDLRSTAQLFTTMAAYGVSLFAASGDNGAYGGADNTTVEVEYPASDPSVTGVGGTSLYLNSSTGAVTSETAWSYDGMRNRDGTISASGGGISGFFARPSWQAGATVPAGTMRLVPDVALAADPNTGGYLVLHGQVMQYGGTSWSTPCWAGLCALLNQGRASVGLAPLGLAGPAFYPLLGTANFRDIITGSNGVYPAGIGYDSVTGIGVPQFATLLGSLAPANPQAPAITSALTATAQAGAAFSYQVTATNSPLSFSASGLPQGLAVNAAGLISGTPAAAGTSSVALTATNAAGTGTATLVLTVQIPVPAITSALAAGGQVGTPFTYQLTASNSPTSLSANGLPGGLTVSAAGLISGTPTVPGTYALTLGAANSTGTATATLVLTILPAAPAITSALAVTGEVGVPLTYQITAANAPTGFSATGLPAGLAVDPALGVITGTPAQAGTFSIELSAANAGGTGTATLILDIASIPVVTIAPSVPEVSSGGGQAGQFALTRTGGDPSLPLAVAYTVEGSARPGVDYMPLKGTKKIKGGKTVVFIAVVPLGSDLGGEGKRAVKITLAAPADGSYVVGAAAAAKVKIVAGQ